MIIYHLIGFFFFNKPKRIFDNLCYRKKVCYSFRFFANISRYKSAIYVGFSLNGELLMDALGGETSFADVQGDSFVPAFTLGVGQKARLTFGQDVNTLKFFTTCGLQEGYEPFCV